MIRENPVKNIDREQAVTAIQQTAVKTQTRWKAATPKQRKIVGGIAAGALFLSVVNACSGEDTAPAPSPDQKSAVETTSTGLGGTAAQAACDYHAQQEFPYGVDAHWVLGKLVERIEEDTFFFKVEADVTNSYNATQYVNIECRVTGSDDNPRVVEFIYY